MKMVEFVFYSGVAVALFTFWMMWKTDRAYSEFIKEVESEIEKRTNEKKSKAK